MLGVVLARTKERQGEVVVEDKNIDTHKLITREQSQLS